jgi:hypothetical protein
MTTLGDVVPVTESLSYSAPPPAASPEELAPISHQEINERRARVENAELLRHLRGL